MTKFWSRCEDYVLAKNMESVLGERKQRNTDFVYKLGIYSRTYGNQKNRSRVGRSQDRPDANDFEPAVWNSNPRTSRAVHTQNNKDMFYKDLICSFWKSSGLIYSDVLLYLISDFNISYKQNSFSHLTENIVCPWQSPMGNTAYVNIHCLRWKSNHINAAPEHNTNFLHVTADGRNSYHWALNG